ncbi:tagatose-bisphosphate aldolase [Ornithinibacillus gellani]|nr:tagatose-bisphosphate aldolase [Ornithinibacillus gellani]TQS71217.1 tagatose-bisphosphate aldolase [Ornithinibacillus gellani]
MGENLKQQRLQKLMNDSGYFSALAIDQRGALKRMMGQETTTEQMEAFKTLVSSELTKYASAILLDPEYGWPAAAAKDAGCGLLVAYEKTGYDTSEKGRFPSLLPEWSVKRLVEKGADGIKVLLYHDIDDESGINEKKDVFIERIGSECQAEEIPFFLEIITYSEEIEDVKGAAYAKVKPQKVISSMKHYADPRFNVDVLKVEVPVTMGFVEGYADGEVLYTKEEAAAYFKEQSEATNIPYIFLSAGVSAQLFQDTLVFAKEAGAKFHGVLCGRATWSGAADAYKESGESAAVQWLQDTGKANITELNGVLEKTASAVE